MILCQCAAVSDSTVRRVIREGADSLAEVTRRCGAGRCCAPCREEIAALLGALRASTHNAGADPPCPERRSRAA